MLVRGAGDVEEDLYSFRFTLGHVSANLIPYAQLLVGYSFLYTTDLQVVLSLPTTVSGFVFRVSQRL